MPISKRGISNSERKKVGIDGYTVGNEGLNISPPLSSRKHLVHAKSKSNQIRKVLSINKQIIPRKHNDRRSRSRGSLNHSKRSMSADHSIVSTASNSEAIDNRGLKKIESNRKYRGELPGINKHKILSHHSYLPSRYEDNPYIHKSKIKTEGNELSQDPTGKIKEGSASKFYSKLGILKNLKRPSQNKKLRTDRL